MIPLHNGTKSIGVVINQDTANSRRKSAGKDNEMQPLADFYHSCFEFVPKIQKLLSTGTLVTDLKTASDYSYHSSSYSTPYTRSVGDAGCFIDPFFSSGVHLALTAALSAAATICASIKGNCDEETAGKWHSDKVDEAYTKFLVVILGTYRQIRSQDEDVLSTIHEGNFDRAFEHIRPSMKHSSTLLNTCSPV